MNKNEQNRVVAWRLKLLRQANDPRRGVAQTCRHFGLSRKTHQYGPPDGYELRGGRLAASAAALRS